MRQLELRGSLVSARQAVHFPGGLSIFLPPPPQFLAFPFSSPSSLLQQLRDWLARGASRQHPFIGSEGASLSRYSSCCCSRPPTTTPGRLLPLSSSPHSHPHREIPGRAVTELNVSRWGFGAGEGSGPCSHASLGAAQSGQISLCCVLRLQITPRGRSLPLSQCGGGTLPTPPSAFHNSPKFSHPPGSAWLCPSLRACSFRQAPFGFLALDKAAQLPRGWQSVPAAIVGTSDSANETPLASLGSPLSRVQHLGYFRLGPGSRAGNDVRFLHHAVASFPVFSSAAKTSRFHQAL